MNIRVVVTSVPPQVAAIAAAMLAGLCVVASVDAAPRSPVERLAGVEAPGAANRR